jgi:mono/diheme cytochrome c family protein
MFMHRLLSFLALPILAAPLRAQDGQQLYTLYCSACHATDGKGATGGAFPPLAGSAWVEGDPKRSVAIVLKGLQGPIEVKGKAYNLVMPPQGEVLGNDQIVAILNYVHSAWGNKGEQVRRDIVNTVRSEYEAREEPWTAPEILKLYPLPIKETALKNLISKTYKGQWSQIPDFNRIQAENVEEEHDGILRPSVSAMENHFGVVWEGEFMAPESGDYQFILRADDGARLILNGETVAEIEGTGPLSKKREKIKSTSLKKGANSFRVEYFQGAGEQGLLLGWKLKDEKQYNWLSEDTAKSLQGWPTMMLAATGEKTVIYRNFIEGTTSRAIGFGFPGGLNLVYSADHIAPELVWSGEFIDAGRHWTGRGQGKQPPAGETVISLTNERFLPEGAKFKGYSVDASGNPTFTVKIGDAILKDSWIPGEPGSLLRKLELSGTSDSIRIPTGSAAITGLETVTLSPGKPVALIYSLK